MDVNLKTQSHFNDHGIFPEIFPASDGYLPPLLNKYLDYSKNECGNLSYFKSFNDFELSRKKHFIESPGAIGYIDTFIRVLKDAKSNGYKSILIFEDDVILAKDFNQRLNAFNKKLPTNWKFLGLGASQYKWSSVDIQKAKANGLYTPKQVDTCGSFAIALKNTIFDELIELLAYFDSPADLFPIGEIYKKYPSECFTAFPYMAMPDVRTSSIRGSRNQLNHAKKMKWQPELFTYPLKRPRLNLILTSTEETKYYQSFSNAVTFPFELHCFIPSLDGLRPYHDSAQTIEESNNDEVIVEPSSGYCIKSKKPQAITEDSLLNLYESLEDKQKTTTAFKVIKAKPHEINENRVSVIIPTYKRSDYLRNVVLSVIEQDYENKEIIVVDDNDRGSEAQIATKHVVTKLIKDHPDANLIYISQSKNRNGSAARNTGFFRSTGNYICFLDDDDIYLPGRLSKSIKKLKNTSDYIGGVYCGFVGWNGAEKIEQRYSEGNLTLELLSLNYLSHFLHTNTATYKRDALITLNGFDETFKRHQDIELNLRFFEHYGIVVVKKALIHLKPQTTNINNQQYGTDLFETKLKFLKKFEYIINRYDPATRKRIYETHWSRVIKSIPDLSFFTERLSSDLSNGHVQCLLGVIKNQNQLKEDQLQESQKQNVILKNKIVSLRKELDELTVSDKIKLNYWQLKGASFFGVLFRVFITPPHQDKLKKTARHFFSRL